MIKFNKTIVQFGFGAVGKSFFEKISKEIKYDEYKYIIISRDKLELEAFINLGGISTNFYVHEVNRENYQEIFSKYLKNGDLLIDFADTVGTREICNWCAENNIMYLNTGEADWPDNWYSIFEENLKKHTLMEKYNNSNTNNLYPIILQHGNNPGLVSHFVKAGIEYIVKKQFKKDKNLNQLLKEKKFNLIAKDIGLKMIHVNDIDTQKVEEQFKDNTLYSTWCIDSFFFEMLSEATMNVGTHEVFNNKEDYKYLDKEKGFLEFNKLAVDKKGNTYYPNGEFKGFLVPHEETITIANSLEVKENGKTIYRPSVMFLYSPCDYAKQYFEKYKLKEYNPLEEADYEILEDKEISRGFLYPKFSKILYKENISSGTEYVGVLLLGENFNPVWVGNRIETNFLYKNKKDSYWQTPTITPVSMSALSAVCWMLENQDKGGIYFPDDIPDYKYIIKKAEKYISKTIYKTFDKEEVSEKLNIDFSNIQYKDFFNK